MSLNIVYTPIAELTFKEELFLNIKVLEGANMSLQNTIEHYNAISEVTRQKHYLALVDVGNYFTIEPDALHYASLPETIGKRIAAGHYRSSAANTFTTHHFVTTYKPPIPIQIFETKAEAKEWLQELYNDLMVSGASLKK